MNEQKRIIRLSRGNTICDACKRIIPNFENFSNIQSDVTVANTGEQLSSNSNYCKHCFPRDAEESQLMFAALSKRQKYTCPK